MNLKIKCAYCPEMITYVLKGASEFIVSQRSAVFDNNMKCPSCGSVSIVEISTKRKSKGKKCKEQEAEAKRELLATIEKHRVFNAQVGDELLGMLGCTCRERSERRASSSGWGGHALSTGWTYCASAGGMLPTVPRHFYQCPCRGTVPEQNILTAHKIAAQLPALNARELTV